MSRSFVARAKLGSTSTELVNPLQQGMSQEFAPPAGVVVERIADARQQSLESRPPLGETWSGVSLD